MASAPIIGISCAIDYEKGFTYLNQGYYKAIQECGAIPVLLVAEESGFKEKIIESLNGVILSGGPDIDPAYFGEESLTFNGNICPNRDEQEIALAKHAFSNDRPILGICRGMQVLNVAMGGTLYQDINAQIKVEGILKHVQQAPRWYPSHNIDILKESKIYQSFGKDNVRVNSFHHQAIKDVAPYFRAVAHTSDGIIEAIEYCGEQYVVGVQWHPETMWEKYSLYLKIFKDFIKECM